MNRNYSYVATWAKKNTYVFTYITLQKYLAHDQNISYFIGSSAVICTIHLQKYGSILITFVLYRTMAYYVNLSQLMFTNRYKVVEICNRSEQNDRIIINKFFP